MEDRLRSHMICIVSAMRTNPSNDATPAPCVFVNGAHVIDRYLRWIYRRTVANTEAAATWDRIAHDALRFWSL